MIFDTHSYEAQVITEEVNRTVMAYRAPHLVYKAELSSEPGPSGPVYWWTYPNKIQPLVFASGSSPFAAAQEFDLKWNGWKP